MSSFNLPLFLQTAQSLRRMSLAAWVNLAVAWMGAVVPVITTGGIVIALALVLYYSLKVWLSLHPRHQSSSILEVKPFQVTLQSSFSTQQLFSILSNVSASPTLINQLFGLHDPFSLELVSTKKEGIRYLVRVKSADAGFVTKSLVAYLPGIKITPCSDYLVAHRLAARTQIAEYAQSAHFAFPLNQQKLLNLHDPIAYITGNMTKLKTRDLLVFQIVAAPLNPALKRNVTYLLHALISGTNLIPRLKSMSHPLTRRLLVFLSRLLLLPLGLVVSLFSGGKAGPFFPAGVSRNGPGRQYENDLEQAVKTKLSQPLFIASVRFLVSVESDHNAASRLQGFHSALTAFTKSGSQSLVSFLKPPWPWLNRLKLRLLSHRLLNPFKRSLLSASELADLFHFPFTTTTKTEGLAKQLSRELPPPLSLKQTRPQDIVFADNTFGGTTTPIGMTVGERRRHLYILGATGTGKSTLLFSMIKQDMEHQKGLCLIDPHGDLTDQVLSVIPPNRLEDVVYFNPDDIGYPLGLNILELTPGLSSEDALREKEFIAEGVISIFHKLYADKYSGPRMEYILRNTLHTAFTVPDATLFTVYKLLINPSYRKSVIRGLDDPNLIDFWQYEFAKSGDYQKVKMISPITNKIGRFLFSPSAKRIIEQPQSTLDFDAIINRRHILLCNLAKGKIGEDNSNVFGALVIAKLQLSALKRARLKPEKRPDFYLYVDEFQNFATPSFAQILSEARKYRLNAILAHQTTSQIDDDSLIEIMLANTGTVICFKTANPQDERLILPQFQPSVNQGEIANLPAYHFYIRLGALEPQEPFSGVTRPLPLARHLGMTTRVIAHSRQRYAHPYVVYPVVPQVKKAPSPPAIVYEILP